MTSHGEDKPETTELGTESETRILDHKQTEEQLRASETRLLQSGSGRRFTAMFHLQRYRVTLCRSLLALACCVCSPGVSWSADEFLVIAYPGPPADQADLQRYREITEAGIDVIVPGNGVWDSETTRKALDLAARAGLRVIVTDLRILPWHATDREEIDQANVNAVVADYSNHPALLAYLICDEPNATYFAELSSTSRKLKIADPKHPPLINLFPSYASKKQLGCEGFAEYVRSFITTVKPAILSYDHYPLREPNAGETDWHGDLTVIRNESRTAGIPFWICLQSEGIQGGLRIPTRPEIFWQAGTALAYGTRGVIWFTYWTPSPTQEIPRDAQDRPYLVEQHVGGMLTRSGKRTPRYDYVRQANRFLHEAGRALTGWDNTEVTRWKLGRPTDDGQSPCISLRGEEFSAVVGTFSRGDRRRVVIANDSYANPAEFTIKPQHDWRLSKVVATLEAERTIESDDPSTWTLAPGGCLVVDCFAHTGGAGYPGR